jgi:superoxide dismutase, Fe-Mn family
MENKLPRRNFLKAAGLTVAGTVLMAKSGSLFAQQESAVLPSPFVLPSLPYKFDALEPHIDALTMEIHHDRHHKAYVDNLNKAVTENKIEERSLENLLSKVSTYPTAVRNNAGGHYNHSLFWNLMKPNGGGLPKGNLADALESIFGEFENFKTKFNDAATGRFGSGWAWLTYEKGRIVIGSTPNQDNPLMDVSEIKGTPILALDVWEHAYYLHYQNKRKDYINAWWNLVNWDEAEKYYNEARG